MEEKSIEFYKKMQDQILEINWTVTESKRDYTESEKEILEKVIRVIYIDGSKGMGEKMEKRLIDNLISNPLYIINHIEGKIKILENDKLEYWENPDFQLRGDDSSIRFAVDWWGGELQNPTFDNQDDSIESLQASLAATNFVQDKPVSDLKTKRFQRELYNQLCRLLRSYKEDAFVALTTDYAPIGHLQSIVEDCGLENYMFPWKIDMLVYKEKVILGKNNSDYQTIFPSYKVKKMGEKPYKSN